MDEQPTCKECEEYLFSKQEIDEGIHLKCREKLAQVDLEKFIDEIFLKRSSTL